MRSYSHGTTSGSISRRLLRYAIPAIMGDLLQVTCNAVDPVILDRFAGAEGWTRYRRPAPRAG